MDEKGELKREVRTKIALVSASVGAVVWGVFAVLAGVMFVSMGAWPVVVWPFVLYFWANHVARAAVVVVNELKPKAEPRNVTFNIRTEQTAEEIAEAANRALSDQKYWNLISR